MRRLAAFERARLAAGEIRAFSFTLPLRTLGLWDVAHGRWTVDPGTYEVLAGGLSAGFAVAGEDPAPRPLLVRGLEAADFDAQSAVTLVDRTKVRGDAVASGADEVGRLVFRACDFGTGPASVIVDAARSEPGEASVELHLGDGTALGTVTVPSTGGAYTYTALRVEPADPPTGVHDLHITMRGALRLARLSFSG